MDDCILAIEDLVVSHDQHNVVEHLSLRVERGEIVALLGASGCGKTTTLKAIAGLLVPDSGKIVIAQQDVCCNGRSVPPEHRHLAMIFQDYALFPHLNVIDNIMYAFPKMASSTKKQQAKAWLQKVDLAEVGERFPHQLSGGQQQRVAVARALASKPNLILMDEPFSNIDAQVRLALAIEVRALLKQQNVGAVLVTHSREEAFAVADKVAVMRDGKIVQFGTPQWVYERPNSRFVAEFMGEGSYLTLSCNGQKWSSRHFPEQQFLLDKEVTAAGLFIRPHQLVLTAGNAATIVGKRFIGGSNRFDVQLDEIRLLVDAAEHHPYAVGDNVGIVLNDANVSILTS